MAKVFSVVPLELRPDVKGEDFEKFWLNTFKCFISTTLIVCYTANALLIMAVASSHVVKAASANSSNIPTTPIAQSSSLFTTTQHYEHPSGWFSMEAPVGWKVKDISNDFAMMVTIDEPSNRATLFVRTQQFDENVSPTYMGRALRLILGLHFLGAPNIKNLVRKSTVAQPDGSVTMAFTFDSINNGKTVPMRGEGYLRLYKQVFASTLVFAVPADQFDRLQSNFLTLLSRFAIHPEAVDPDRLVIDAIVPFRHANGVFEIDVPQGWRMSDESGPDSQMVKFFDAADRAGMVVEIIRIPVTSTLDTQALTTGMQRFIKQEYQQLPNLVIFKPEIRDESTVSLIFTYDALINQHKTSMMGLCQMQRRGNILATFRIMVPMSIASRLSIPIDNLRASLKLYPEAR